MRNKTVSSDNSNASNEEEQAQQERIPEEGGQQEVVSTNDSLLHQRQQRRRITKIQIQAGAIVDGITITYSNDSTGKVCGGEGYSGDSISFLENEHVVKIDLKYNTYVQRITFWTNFGRKVGPCGGGGTFFLGGTSGTETSIEAPEGCMLVGLHGRADKYLNAIGFHWAPIIDKLAIPFNYHSTNLFGGNGGKMFDHGHGDEEGDTSESTMVASLPVASLLSSPDEEKDGVVATSVINEIDDKSPDSPQLKSNAIELQQKYIASKNDTNQSHHSDQTQQCRRISKIQIQSGAIVDGITVTYSNDSTGKVCGGEGHSGNFIAFGEDEYVVKIDLKYNIYVQRITFWTNLGRKIGPNGEGGAFFLGGTSGTEISIEAPEGCMLVGLHGRADTYLNAIGFHWAPVITDRRAEKEDVEGKEVQKVKITSVSTQLYGGGGGIAFDHGHFIEPPQCADNDELIRKKEVPKQMEPIDIACDEDMYFLGNEITGVVELNLKNTPKKGRDCQLLLTLEANKLMQRNHNDSDDEVGSEGCKKRGKSETFDFCKRDFPWSKHNTKIPFKLQLPESLNNGEWVMLDNNDSNNRKDDKKVNNMHQTEWKITAKLFIPDQEKMYFQKLVNVNDENIRSVEKNNN